MKFFCIFSLLQVLILSSCGYGQAVEKKNVQLPTVTLKMLDVKVEKIIKDVSEQVGYTVQIEGELKDEVVSGRYIDVSLDQFFHRIFKHRNVVVDIDTHEKKVLVHLFNSSIGGKFVNGHVTQDKDSILALSNVSLSELDDIFVKEEEIYKNWKNDPEAVMPFTGINKLKFNEIIEHEGEAYEAQKQDMGRQVALSSLTHKELSSILEREGKEEQKRRQDTNEKVALSSMTQAQLKARLNKENLENNQKTKDPNALIPFSNVTNAEFHAVTK